MKRLLNNILDINALVLLIFVFTSLFACSQIQWGHSENYNRLKGNRQYKYIYKINTIYGDTWTYYEIADRKEMDTLNLYMVDFDGNPRCYEAITLLLDTKDTTLITDSNGYASVTCNKAVNTLYLIVFYSTVKIKMPLSLDMVPLKTNIVIGKIPKSCLLNIYSKRPLGFSEIKNIKDNAVNMNPFENEDYYYFYSEF